MKRYLLFTGFNYYPDGGWEDFVSDHDEQGEAESAGMSGYGDWWHVVDTAARDVVSRGEKGTVTWRQEAPR